MSLVPSPVWPPTLPPEDGSLGSASISPGDPVVAGEFGTWTVTYTRSEEHTSELQSGYISYAVFCLKKQNNARFNFPRALQAGCPSGRRFSCCWSHPRRSARGPSYPFVPARACPILTPPEDLQSDCHL